MTNRGLLSDCYAQEMGLILQNVIAFYRTRTSDILVMKKDVVLVFI